MNEEKINQILKNQATIFLALSDDNRYSLETIVSLNNRMRETNFLLTPIKEKSIRERTHDALSESSEVKG